MRNARGSTSYPGTAWRNEIYVNVRWGWLGFLGGELVLAGAFVLFTIVVTHLSKVPVLKGSAIASLLGADGATQTAVGTILDLDKALAKAETVHARRDGKVLLLAHDNLNSPGDLSRKHSEMSEEVQGQDGTMDNKHAVITVKPRRWSIT